jgi:hypothetical protein
MDGDARVGDRLVILGRYVHRPVREGEILEVRGDGGPPYLVRWDDSGRETLIYPGSDALVQHPPVVVDERVGRLGRPARAADGGSTLGAEEAVELIRSHLDLEKVRSTDRDDELWGLWQEELERSVRDVRVAVVLDRVLARVRDGE